MRIVSDQAVLTSVATYSSQLNPKVGSYGYIVEADMVASKHWLVLLVQDVPGLC